MPTHANHAKVARNEGWVKDPASEQARRILARFGGPYGLSQALKRLEDKRGWRSPSQLYRWTYPKGPRGGTGGVIPTSMILYVKEAARLHGIFLKPEDWTP